MGGRSWSRGMCLRAGRLLRVCCRSGAGSSRDGSGGEREMGGWSAWRKGN